MDLVDSIPGFSKADRLGLTAFGSVLVHLVLILGVSFTLPEATPEERSLPSLEITLVNTRSDLEPDKADFLAQANQEGGGDSAKPVIARSPLPMQPSTNKTDRIPVAQLRSEPTAKAAKPAPELLTQDKKTALQVAKIDPNPPTRKKSQQPNKPGLVQDSNANERMRLSAEISQFWQEYQKRPRRKFLSARTKEYKYAAYMEAWRSKVERVGNLNYPEQAKRHKLTGRLVLDVEIRPNGKLNAITLIRPSGHKLLDDAAMRIVRLSAPFDPFPKAIRGQVDILHITRTWQFMRGNRLVSR